ncbi:hypothetical protein M406DRAFT_70629 [Cryphonectria parasitica EP155]|uniref:N-acetyltransferase domain-containing protein n=1 Tax=Cryphonectria parasitica (strain ATCC 38755 / EP155) TaxID=660469 RepID=A0A9P4Y1N7_CRYP1|nr:uncharacterized protein M406DRAFT_70629 [Cryphonectria parasitica EP155]KAF3764858.1 hypothetical protein M406DRAFT_70629 [Cryphonectria parasitica EP155]
MGWTVERIAKDEAGIAFYLQQYKPFRLLSLERDPSAFGSTLSREEAFDEGRWRDRLLNPQASTFVAREEDTTRSILSSITLVGPDPVSEELRSALNLAGQTLPPGQLLHWELNGVFTLPQARRCGIAAAVMSTARQHALAEAALQGSGDCLVVLTVVVYAENSGARSWYEKMGFTPYRQDKEDQGRATIELVQVLHVPQRPR